MLVYLFRAKPVYHDRRRNRTRGRLKRKKLDDMAELLIQKAREHRVQFEMEQENERIRQLDNIMNNSDFAVQLDKCCDGSITDPKYGEEGKKVAAPDAYLEKVYEVLDKELPPIGDLTARVNRDLKNKIEGKRIGSRKISPEALTKEKDSLLKRPKKMVGLLKSHYKDVSEGKMSPDVLKLFLNSPLMANTTISEHRLYFHVVNRNEKYDKPTEEEIRDHCNTYIFTI